MHLRLVLRSRQAGISISVHGAKWWKASRADDDPIPLFGTWSSDSDDGLRRWFGIYCCPFVLRTSRLKRGAADA